MEKYWYWLCSCPGLYRNHIKKLLDIYDSPRRVFEASENKLYHTELKEKQILPLLESRKKWDLEKKYRDLKQSKIQFISAEHESYPEKLKKIPDYPYGLFIKGSLPDPCRLSVAVVGARGCSAYGKNIAEEIAAALADYEVQVISGMARGIDGYSQQAALDAGGSSFGVLGCGVDICYPRENRRLYSVLTEQGGVLSEYPPQCPPLAVHFPMRNRIISALSEAVVVIEAKEKSGSLITADLALEQGGDVWAVPGRIGDVLSRGCNRLIGQGAGIIASVEDLILNLNLNTRKSKKCIKNKFLLETNENLVYSCVDFQLRSLEHVLAETKLPVSEVMNILTTLVLRGFIKEPVKNYYIKS